MSLLSILSNIRGYRAFSQSDSGTFTTHSIVTGDLWDNAYNGTSNPPRNTHSRIIFTTNANQIKFTASTNWSELSSPGSVYWTLDNVAQTTVAITDGVEVTLTLGNPGVSKRVELINGDAYLPLGDTNVLETHLTEIRYPDNRTFSIITPEVPELVILGDSITIGHQATDPGIDGFVARLRRIDGRNIAVDGWSYKTLWDIAKDDAAILATLNRLEIFNCPRIRIMLQTNDFGKDATYSWSAANYGSGLADFLDAFHLRFPTWKVDFQSAIIRTLEGSESTATNSFGNTLPDYRSASASVCAARSSYVRYIDGLALMDASYLVDGLHPGDAGHIILEADVLTSLTDYFVNYTSGNDANDGLTPATAWKTINKINTSTFAAGKVIGFKRGERWNETLIPPSSGSSGSPITFTSYGTGAKPIISAGEILSAWTNLGGGIYEATYTLATGDIKGMSIDGEEKEIGRYPKRSAARTGWLYPDSIDLTAFTITYSALSGQDYTGAHVVYHYDNYEMFKTKITAMSGGVIHNIYMPDVDRGFFIQNHIEFLTEFGEWMFDTATNKIKMYFGSENPVDHIIEVTGLDNCIVVKSKDYINFENLQVQSSNINAIEVGTRSHFDYDAVAWVDSPYTPCSYINFDKVDGYNIGQDLFSMAETNYISYTNGNIRNVNNTAFMNDNRKACNYVDITDNSLVNIGNLEGMAILQPGYMLFGMMAFCFEAVDVTNINILRNYVENVGYNGTRFNVENGVFQGNIMIGCNKILGEGGAVYMWNNYGYAVRTSRLVDSNIIMRVGGGSTGWSQRNDVGDESEFICGINMDDNADHVIISNNIISAYHGTIHNNVVQLGIASGISLHNAHHITMDANEITDCPLGIISLHDAIGAGWDADNLTITNNKILATRSDYLAISIGTITLAEVASAFLSIDNNHYGKPVGTHQNLFEVYTHTAMSETFDKFYDFDEWKSRTGFDASGTVISTNRLEYGVDTLYTNIVPNSYFETDISHVGGDESPNANMVLSQDNKLDGKALEISFTSPVSNQDYAYVWMLDCGTIDWYIHTSPKPYILKFSEIASVNNRHMKVRLNVSTTVGDPVTPDQQVKLTTSRSEQQLLFYPQKDTGFGSVMFTVDDENSAPIWIDNLTLQHADVTMIDQTAYWRYEQNISDTDTTVDLGSDSYKDLLGTIYTGVTALPAKSALALIKI